MQTQQTDPLTVKLTKFQDEFLFSAHRFPAFIASVGTGKTFMGLVKAWNSCEEYPGSLWLVVRKEFTDLRDSTLKDFTRYFGVDVDTNKEYRFKNRSTIMFRHGAETNVLKNITLDGFVIEQAEEFENDEQFTFLRDRLRGRSGPTQQGCILANAAGHNWIWDLWVNSSVVDGSFASMKYCQPKGKEFFAVLARTEDNAINLPKDYVEDLKRMEKEAPEHYRQYVLNDFSTQISDDALLSPDDLKRSLELALNKPYAPVRIMGVDVARYGGNEIVFSILESRGAVQWEQIHQVAYAQRGLDESIGRAISLIKDFEIKLVVVDDDGLGGGMTDMLRLQGLEVKAFRGGLPIEKQAPGNVPHYDMIRSAAYFRVQEWIRKGWLKVMDDPKLHAQLLSIRYKFKPDGARHVLSKEEMRLKKGESPDRADALMMALWFSDSVPDLLEAAAMNVGASYDYALEEISRAHGNPFTP